MTSIADQLKALLDDTTFRTLELLANTSSPVSGRALARSLGVSPTTAMAALTRLKAADFIGTAEIGRAKTWYLNERNPTIRAWLAQEQGHAPANDPTARPQMTVVIFTAIQEEYAAVAAHLPERRAARAGTTRFEVDAFTGNQVAWEVYIAEIGAGNAVTAAEVTSAAMTLKPDLVLFCGVAGSVKPADLCRGDVVVAERVYNLHAGKDIGSHTGGSDHLTRPLSGIASHGVVQLARTVRQKDWISELATGNAAGALNAKGKRPRVEIRAIAAGEVVHSDDRSQLMAKVRNNLNDAAAVDMESWGLYEAAHVRGLPALAIRGISDSVGDKQPGMDEEWQPRVVSHAAAFSFALLRHAEPEDFRSQGVQLPSAEGPSDEESDSPREMLFRLPPPVSTVYQWAHPIAGEGATAALKQLAALDGQPATWLSRFRHRPPVPFRDDTNGTLWVLVAEFADSHEHPTASWLYEQAADRSGDGVLRAYLYSRAARAAMRSLDSEEAGRLSAKAENTAPAGHILWQYHRAAFTSDAKAVLAATPPLARALHLGFSRTVLEAMGPAEPAMTQEEELSDFVEEFAERHPALLEQERLSIALTTAFAFELTGQLNLAQMLLEGLTDGLSAYGAGQSGVSALGFLVGARSSTILLQMARILYARAVNPANQDTVLDLDAALARAEDLAMTARDRRFDWGGPTGELVKVAAQARAATGDIRGALRLLLPPPRGTARATEAATQPAVQAAAQLAVGIGEAELALELSAKINDTAERRLATALALTLRSDSWPEAIAEYRSALADSSILTRPDQQIRALLGLSMITELSSDELARLKGIDPEIADLVLAQSHLTAGRTSEAQILARQYPDSDGALRIRVAALVNQGNSTAAISALETYANRHGTEGLLLEAAGIALSSGLADEASRLATRVASSLDPTRRRVGREILIQVASSDGEWEAVLNETRRLLNDDKIAETDSERDASVRKYRWAQAHAFHQLRQIREAYEVIRADPRLVPEESGQARLIVSVLRTIAPTVSASSDPGEEANWITQSEVLSVVSEAAQAFPEDEELVATAVMTVFAMPASAPPDPLLMIRARKLQQQFFERFPDSTKIRLVPIDNIKEVLRSQVAPVADIAERMRLSAVAGQLPISVCVTALQRSYSDALIRNSFGCYVISNPDPHVTAEEIDAARRALDGTVVIDTSALFLARVTWGTLTELRARFDRLLITELQRDDILITRAALLTRAAGALGWDPVSERPTLAQYDESLTERWASEATELAAALALCEIVSDPPHNDDDPRNREWSSPIRVARERGISLVADDAALRAVARNEGVAAFGSLELLSALVADGRLPEDALEASFRRLMEIRAAELPVAGRLLEIAADEHWNPTGYAGFLLSRPSTWITPADGWQTYTTVIRALPDKTSDQSAGWCAAAAFGLCLTTPSQRVPVVVGALVAWTMLELGDPGALPTLLTSAGNVVTQFVRGADLLKEVVQALVATITRVTPSDQVAKTVLRLFSGLAPEARTRAVEYFFTMP